MRLDLDPVTYRLTVTGDGLSVVVPGDPDDVETQRGVQLAQWRAGPSDRAGPQRKRHRDLVVTVASGPARRRRRAERQGVRAPGPASCDW